MVLNKADELGVRKGSRERAPVCVGFVPSTSRFGCGVCVLVFVLPSSNDNDERFRTDNDERC